jgi:hypothetical protein
MQQKIKRPLEAVDVNRQRRLAAGPIVFDFGPKSIHRSRLAAIE